MGVLRDIKPWLPAGWHGKWIHVTVVVVFVKIGLLVMALLVLLALLATGHL